MPATPRAPRLPYDWLLALRFLREGRAQTLLILLGITLGVGVIVFLTALIDGLQQNIIARTLGVQAHVVVTAPDDRVREAWPRTEAGAPLLSQTSPRAQRLRSIPGWQQTTTGIAALPGVRDVAAIVSGPASARRGQAERQVALLGVVPEEYQRIVPLGSYLVEGNLRLQTGEAAVGTELARELGLRVGDRLRLQTATRDDTFIVAGLFTVGVREADERWVFVPRRSAQTLLELEGGATHIQVTVDDIFAATQVAGAIGERFDVKSESWMQVNRQLMTGLRSQSASSSIIRFFVLVSVAFGIASVLAVSVAQKQREIGILRAMGTRRSMVLRVFLIQGGVLGVAGSLLGALAGTGLALLFGNLALNPDGTPVVPVMITPSLFVAAVLTATVTGLLAAALPARRAARLDPVEAIRNG